MWHFVATTKINICAIEEARTNDLQTHQATKHVEKLQQQLEHALKLGHEARITQFITHRGAKAFWHRHLSDKGDTTWDFFADIVRKLERDSKQPPASRLDEKEMDALRKHLDRNGNGRISVYGARVPQTNGQRRKMHVCSCLMLCA